MKTQIKTALTVLAVAMATHAAAQITFYENNGYQGRSFTTERPVPNFDRVGFNDRASSVEVSGNRWEVCDDVRFSGRCVVLRPGQYPSLGAMGLNDRISSARTVSRNARIDERRYAPIAVVAPAAPQVTFYENNDFQGRSFTSENSVENFNRFGFNDRASSVEVIGGPWEICEDAQFNGRCVVLRPGRYPSLGAMGLNDRVSSVRTVNRGSRAPEPVYAPAPVAQPDFRRRDNERLYDVNVTSVRAVVGTPEQRCWVEREQVAQTRNEANVPGAIAGALIGGILGHQVGGGTGKDLATVGGAVAGAALGSNVGRDNGAQQPAFQDVKRCENVPSHAKPQYWDVTYDFRGQQHRVQLSSPPGPTLTVNEHGEPRK